MISNVSYNYQMFLTIIVDGIEVALNPGDPSIIVGGPFNRWLNITRTIISASALTADTAIYMCEVCIARGTPFEECHTANVTLYIIGGPPFIDKAPNNSELSLCVYVHHVINQNSVVLE